MTSTAPTTVVVVASIQASSVMLDPAANEAKFVPLIREAAGRGAKFIVLPETAITGYLSQDLHTVWQIPGRPLEFERGVDPAPFAETNDGPLMQRMGDLSRELSVYLTVPYVEKEVAPLEASDDDEGDANATVVKYYNSVALVGPSGAVLGNYRKMSPWPYPEKSWASKGTEPVVVDTEYGRVGLAICFDIHSTLAKYARHKIWALLYPIAWVGEPDEWFRLELPKLMKECNCPHYVLGCNWSTDKKEAWPGAGYSTHYGPQGEVLASTSLQQGSTILYSTLDTAAYQEAQAPLRESRAEQCGVASGGQYGFGALNLDKYATWTAKIGGQAKEWKWN